MRQEPVIVHAILDGEKIKSENWRRGKIRPVRMKSSAIIRSTPRESARAIDSACRAFPGWAKTSVDERVERLRKAIQKIKDATPEIVKLLSRKHGKPLYDAEGEIAVSLMWMEYACDIAKDVRKDEVVEHDHGRTFIAREPKGVISAITLWNYPLPLHHQNRARASGREHDGFKTGSVCAAGRGRKQGR